MVDGIHIELDCFDKSIWLNHPDLHFYVKTNLKTKEKKGSLVAEFRGLRFIISEYGNCHIKGSLHTYYNFGAHNSNRFTFEDLKKAIAQLVEFGVNPDEAKIRSIEFGLNLNLPKGLKAVDVINSILFCKNTKPCDLLINDKKGHGYVYKTTNLCYKFYDKAECINSNNQILRIEIKFVRMRGLKGCGVSRLSDLLNPISLVNVIKKKYLPFINQTVFFEWDQIKSSRLLPKKHKSKFKDLRNPDWWLNDKRARNHVSTNRKLLEGLVNKYASRNIKSLLLACVIDELKNVLLEFEDDYIPSSLDYALKFSANTHSDKMCTSKKIEANRKCLICGKDISHQRKGSKFCSSSRKCRDYASNLKKAMHKKEMKPHLDEVNYYLKELSQLVPVTGIYKPIKLTQKVEFIYDEVKVTLLGVVAQYFICCVYNNKKKKWLTVKRQEAGKRVFLTG